MQQELTDTPLAEAAQSVEKAGPPGFSEDEQVEGSEDRSIFSQEFSPPSFFIASPRLDYKILHLSRPPARK